MKFQKGDLVELIGDDDFFTSEVKILGIVLKEENHPYWGQVMLLGDELGEKVRTQYFGQEDWKLIVHAGVSEYTGLDSLS